MKKLQTPIRIYRLRELEAEGYDDLTIEIIARIDRDRFSHPYTRDLVGCYGEAEVERATTRAVARTSI